MSIKQQVQKALNLENDLDIQTRINILEKWIKIQVLQRHKIRNQDLYINLIIFNNSQLTPFYQTQYTTLIQTIIDHHRSFRTVKFILDLDHFIYMGVFI